MNAPFGERYQRFSEPDSFIKADSPWSATTSPSFTHEIIQPSVSRAEARAMIVSTFLFFCDNRICGIRHDTRDEKATADWISRVAFSASFVGFCWFSTETEKHVFVVYCSRLMECWRLRGCSNKDRRKQMHTCLLLSPSHLNTHLFFVFQKLNMVRKNYPWRQAWRLFYDST